MVIKCIKIRNLVEQKISKHTEQRQAMTRKRYLNPKYDDRIISKNHLELWINMKEKYDEIINNRLSNIKMYCIKIKFWEWKNRISNSKGKGSNINFLTIKGYFNSILFKWMLVRVKSLHYFHFIEFFFNLQFYL